MHESRKLKIMINKSGGSAGKGSLGYTLKLPSVWMNELDISPDDRTIELSFDGKTITIRKADAE